MFHPIYPLVLWARKMPVFYQSFSHSSLAMSSLLSHQSHKNGMSLHTGSFIHFPLLTVSPALFLLHSFQAVATALCPECVLLSVKGQLSHARSSTSSFPFLFPPFPFSPYHPALASFPVPLPLFLSFLKGDLSFISLCYPLLSPLLPFIPVSNHTQSINATSEAA